jgi:hypothetical protein
MKKSPLSCFTNGLNRAIFAALLGSVLLAGTSLGAVQGTLDGVTVYPNPFSINSGAAGVTFDNLTARATLWIFTVEGTVVFLGEIFTNDGKYLWDARSNEGVDAAPGVYLYVIRDKALGGLSKGKLLITR